MEQFTKSDLDQFTDILARPVWDGDLISKQSRNKLVFFGFVSRDDSGYNIITQLGRDWFLAMHPVVDGLLEMVGLDPAEIERESIALIARLRAEASE